MQQKTHSHTRTHHPMTLMMFESIWRKNVRKWKCKKKTDTYDDGIASSVTVNSPCAHVASETRECVTTSELKPNRRIRNNNTNGSRCKLRKYIFLEKFYVMPGQQQRTPLTTQLANVLWIGWKCVCAVVRACSSASSHLIIVTRWLKMKAHKFSLFRCCMDSRSERFRLDCVQTTYQETYCNRCKREEKTSKNITCCNLQMQCIACTHCNSCFQTQSAHAFIQLCVYKIYENNYSKRDPDVQILRASHRASVAI